MRPDVEYQYNYFAPERPLSEDEQKVYDFYEADPSLRAERDRRLQIMFMRKFSGVYSKNVLESDIKILANHYNIKKGDFNQRGELMEFFISKAENANWFGENCSIYRASKYDDIKNFTDLVLEWEDESGQIERLAIDCTVSGAEEGLDQKAGGIMKNLYRGDLSTLNYHESELTDEKKMITQVPKVLLILDSTDIQELSKIFSKIINKESGANSAFSKCYFQLVLLKEIEYQLKFQLDELIRAMKYLADRGRLNENNLRINAQKKLGGVLSIIKNLIQERESSLGASQIQRANERWEESPYGQYLQGLPSKSQANLGHA